MKPPIEVWALLDGEWSEVLWLDFGSGHATCDRNGAKVMLLFGRVLRSNLCWPRGTTATII